MAAQYSMIFMDGITIMGGATLIGTDKHTFLQLKQEAGVENLVKAGYKLLGWVEKGSDELIPDNRIYKASTMPGNIQVNAVWGSAPIYIHNTRIRR